MANKKILYVLGIIIVLLLVLLIILFANNSADQKNLKALLNTERQKVYSLQEQIYDYQLQLNDKNTVTNTDSYNSGYDDGFEVGYDNGLAEGHQNAVTNINSSPYSTGYNDGYNAGYKEAFDKGYFGAVNDIYLKDIKENSNGVVTDIDLWNKLKSLVGQEWLQENGYQLKAD